MKDPTLQRIFGLSGSPDGIGDSAPARAPRSTDEPQSGPGTGLEHMPLYTQRLGQSEPVVATTTGVLRTIASFAVNTGAGVAVGLAIAPDRERRVKYAVVGGVLGLLFGPLGIGGQALYVLAKE